jgi:hypothetical protein
LLGALHIYPSVSRAEYEEALDENVQYDLESHSRAVEGLKEATAQNRVTNRNLRSTVAGIKRSAFIDLEDMINRDVGKRANGNHQLPR